MDPFLKRSTHRLRCDDDSDVDERTLESLFHLTATLNSLLHQICNTRIVLLLQVTHNLLNNLSPQSACAERCCIHVLLDIVDMTYLIPQHIYSSGYPRTLPSFDDPLSVLESTSDLESLTMMYTMHRNGTLKRHFRHCGDQAEEVDVDRIGGNSGCGVSVETERQNPARDVPP